VDKSKSYGGCGLRLEEAAWTTARALVITLAAADPPALAAAPVSAAAAAAAAAAQRPPPTVCEFQLRGVEVATTITSKVLKKTTKVLTKLLAPPCPPFQR
jgi:hypothetical protein